MQKIEKELIEHLEKLLNWSFDKTIDIFLAFLIIYFGFKITKKFSNWLKIIFEKNNLDRGVISFFISFIDVILKTIFILWSIKILGVEMSSIFAIIGSASIAIGLAIQGSLSNITGGILILILKPFQVGDYIIEDTNKNEGTVVSIDIFYTKLFTMDNKTVIIPNGALANSSLTNVTKQDKRRLDIFVRILYSENIKRVKSVLNNVLMKEKNILTGENEEIKIFVNDLSENYIIIGIRAWVPMEMYWEIRWRLLENIKECFDNENIKFANNKLDIYYK